MAIAGGSPFVSPPVIIGAAGAPAFSGAGATWANYPALVSQFAKTSDEVEIRLQCLRVGAPAVFEWILASVLPAAYRPTSERILPALSWNAGFTVATPGMVAVTAAGNVLWYAGDPSTYLQVNGVYLVGA